MEKSDGGEKKVVEVVEVVEIGVFLHIYQGVNRSITLGLVVEKMTK